MTMIAAHSIRWTAWLIACAMVAVAFVTVDPWAGGASAAPTTSRISGTDRYGTAAAVSKAAFPNGAATAYVSSGEDYADALAAGPAAAKAGAPLLLTAARSLPAAASAEIKRLNVKKIVVTGGTGAVSDTVLAQLRALVPTVSRASGSDRYATARAVIASAFTTSPTTFIVSGENFPDALAASAAAAATGAAVVLVAGSGTALAPETRQTLANLGTRTAILVGGSGVLSAGIEAGVRAAVPDVRRVGGLDRYETATALNKLVFGSSPEAILASGIGFADALAGASLAGVRKAPLYTSRPTCVPDAVVADITNRLGATRVTLLGGVGSLGTNVASMMTCSAYAAVEKKNSEQALLNKLNALLPTVPGKHTVSVSEVGGLKRAVSIRGGDRLEPASTIKLFAAYAVLKRVEAGTLFYSTKLSSGLTVAECMRVMIHVSDNLCHTDLMRIMGVDTMNALFAANGYTGTHYAGMWKGTYYSYKTSTSNDLNTLLLRLNAGTLLNASNSNYLLTLMKSQIWRGRIPSGLPPGVVQASKPGELWVSSGLTESDAAIVYAPRGTYVISILGVNGSTKASLARISRVVYEHFNGPISRTATFVVPEMYATAATVLRSSPGGPAIASIPKGTLVEVITSSRQWYQVKVNGRGGYTSSLYLGNRY